MNPGSSFVNLLPAVFLFAVMYFLLIRPQQRRQREHAQLIAGLKKHDEVVTVGGVHGAIVLVKEQTVVLRVDDQAKLEVDKTAVARLTRRAAE
ncbi:MAG: preprotein translocase subunit YajC [Omnitrophica WOR_2 bacterium RIFCSPHIGHO2_02_FULL_68_15]|nr:MAG: preprotein translocase subunit YajC [Omnitrophica WOR_2 bacterium RIFCSPHIGHO2_02_FULL_68_15]